MRARSICSLDIPSLFIAKIAEHDLDLCVRGVLSADDRVYAFGTDTKVLSTVFELLSKPLIDEISRDHDLLVEESPQTVYPDFTLTPKNPPAKRIAIDIKTTYRRGRDGKIGFTLGSYTSFLRNNTKNILHPYDEYCRHWILGFVYSRRKMSGLEPRIYDLKDRGLIESAYDKVEIFVQEKFKIAGDRPGSGNTTNIGSIISADLNDFRVGRGPFADLGEKAFRSYWAQYPAHKTLRDFLE